MIILPILTTSLVHLWENVLFELWSERVKVLSGLLGRVACVLCCACVLRAYALCVIRAFCARWRTFRLWLRGPVLARFVRVVCVSGFPPYPFPSRHSSNARQNAEEGDRSGQKKDQSGTVTNWLRASKFVLRVRPASLAADTSLCFLQEKRNFSESSGEYSTSIVQCSGQMRG